MAPDEYSTGGGGKLKLKGGKVSDGRVEKKKKKSLKKREKAEQAEKTEQDQPPQEEPDEETKSPREDAPEGSAAKTEAERKYEEIRRKRVCILTSCGRSVALLRHRVCVEQS